jgi:Fe-S-cluster containining protein
MADRTPEETQAYAQRGMSEFYDAITPSEQEAVVSALRSVVSTNARTALKIQKIHTIADEAFRHAAGRVACAKGCSLCCYIQVQITKAEAKFIGDRIGIEPKDVSNLPPRSLESFSDKTPCTFLENNECTIYEDRPLECRRNFNFDRDNYWCRYENWDKPGAHGAFQSGRLDSRPT